MLWNVVFEFFVKYIFGGSLYDASIGGVDYSAFIDRVSGTNISSSSILINVFGINLHLGNYFSLIATIISMVVILVLCCALIQKIYNMCAHIIG